MKYAKALAISALSVFLPIKPLLVCVPVIIIIDLITGIWAALKQGHKITSAGLRRTVSKLVIYELGICVGFLIQTYLLEDLLPVTKLIGGMIGIVELKSVFENLDLILGQSFFNLILKQIGSVNDIEGKIKDHDWTK